MDGKSIEEKNQALEAFFEKERANWGKILMPLIEKLRKVGDLTEAQVEMLSNRHKITDSIANYKTMYYKSTANYDSYYKLKYRAITVDYDLKLNGTEKGKFVIAELASLKKQGHLIDTHVSFLRECLTTLDNMGFAIRNRIRVAEEQLM